jgi:polyisoprenoid-binding protein YceI
MLRTFATVALMGCLTNAMLADIDVPLTGENTTVKFVGSKPEGKHEGGFKKLTGSAKFDPTDVTTLKLSVEIDMNSTYSDDEKLTNHLKSPDFFGVKNNPKSMFKSTKVEKTTDGYKVTGDFTLNGKTKSITFPAKIEPFADGIVINSSFTIDRTAFGITYGKGKINNDVSLSIALRAKK